MENTDPLTIEEMDAITEIMKGRRFLVLHYGEEGKGYCNSRMIRCEVEELLLKSARAVTTAKSQGYAPATTPQDSEISDMGARE